MTQTIIPSSQVPTVVDNNGNTAVPIANSDGSPFGQMRGANSFEASIQSADVTSATQVKAGTASKNIYITDISISVDTAGWVKLQDNAGTPAVVIGKKYLPANSVWTQRYQTPKQVATGKDLNVIAQNAGNISVDVNGYVQ